MLVMKFGGTSVGDGSRIRDVARIVLDQGTQEPIVVTSAMAGVTDALLRLHARAADGDAAGYQAQLAAIQAQHLAAAQAIDPALDWSHLHERLNELSACSTSVYARRDASLQARDSLAVWGEILAVILVTGAIDAAGGSGGSWDTPIIVTDRNFGEATPQAEPTRILAEEALAEARAHDAILVAPGFIGITEDSDPWQETYTTLGRGGSDYAATLLAIALAADACWIYTDVDGIYTADPRIVPTAEILPVVSYATAGRLAICGAKVLHPRSVSPAARGGIALRVRNTFKPGEAGTLIQPDTDVTHGQPQAVAGRGKLCAMTLAGQGLAEIPNLFGRLCKAIAEAQVELVLSAHPVPGHDPCVIIATDGAMQGTEQVEREFAAERQQGHLTAINVQDGLALCTLVGDELGRLILEQAQRALASARITVISQSASADALSFIITEDTLDRAIQRIHQDVIEPALREAAQRQSRPYGDGQWAAGGRSQQRRKHTPPQH